LCHAPNRIVQIVGGRILDLRHTAARHKQHGYDWEEVSRFH
jgi:hypothetical protein